MTQEQKDLLLKDLCSRLPYGVMAKFGDSNPSKITNITQGIDSDSWFVESEGEFDGMMCEINNVKPYLFPLSSMTEEQSEELIKLINTGQNDNNEFMRSLCRIEFYHKHHFDYRGLIPMGLSIDATGKNIY